MKLKNTVITVLLAAVMLTGCAIFPADPIKPAATQPSSAAVKPTETATPEPAKEANAVVLSPKYTSAPIFDAATNKEAGQALKGFALQINSQKDGNANFIVSVVDEKTGKEANKEFYIPIGYLTKGYVEPEAVIKIIPADTIVLHSGAPIYDKDGNELAKFTDDLGPMHYIQKTDMGYQLLIDMNVVYIKEKDADLISEVKQPQTANALLISPKYTSAPIYDAASNKEAGQVFKGFALPIESQKDGNANFVVSIVDETTGEVINKEFYIPISYLTKGYVEPEATILMISTDTIVLHAGAPIYNKDGKELAKFTDDLGPMYYIQKTDMGYQLVIGMNVVYIKEKDADLIGEIKQPQTANALLISPKYNTAPFFDAKTKKEAGQIFHGFALQIESQKDGNGTFTVSIDEKGNPVNREFYIPIKYLTKGYVEPQAVNEIISMDSIVLHAGASVYSEEDNSLAKFNGKLGPMHFIQKTDKGYQLLIGFNVVYIKEKDADYIKYKE